MINEDTILNVKAWFIACLQQNRSEVAFERDLLFRKFNFSQELINFLDEINSSQFMRSGMLTPGGCDVWECNALNSILKEAKKFKILKNVRRDMSGQYKYELIQKLIQKMEDWLPYCMLICNFLANSKLSDTPEKYTNLCILCKYWIDCQKALDTNFRIGYQLLG